MPDMIDRVQDRRSVPGMAKCNACARSIRKSENGECRKCRALREHADDLARFESEGNPNYDTDNE